MDGETRSNQGYEIIESCTIGNTELVIGHHPKAPNPYVCWYCKGGDNYYWGCYCNTLEAARENLNERYQSECHMPYNKPLLQNRKAGTIMSGSQKKYDCTTCPYPRYKDRHIIFCDVCIRKILDEKREKSRERRSQMENEEKRMISSYKVTQSIHIGKKEVVFGVDLKEEYPFLVCYCTYDNPFYAEWVTDAVGSDDYLEAMQIFTDRVQEQIGLVRAEQEQFKFDMTPFTIDDCIPDDKGGSIVGKVVVINAEVNRYEYRHSAYQLVLVDGGHGARGGRGQAVFGTSLADGKHARWERCDVLGEIKPEKMPDWAKEAAARIQTEEKAKKSKSREER